MQEAENGGKAYGSAVGAERSLKQLGNYPIRRMRGCQTLRLRQPLADLAKAKSFDDDLIEAVQPAGFVQALGGANANLAIRSNHGRANRRSSSCGPENQRST